ncbi:MAG TPA: glycoside hydrolase family 97 protein [Prolixibacteraceae bacterium]|nr:glycoside hydrolase family 97 protein [Prolixibacteraceae bacterium]
MKKRSILGLAILLLMSFSLNGFSKGAKTIQLDSPDGAIKISLNIGEETTYSVAFQNTVVLNSSPISLTIDQGKVPGNNARLKSQKRKSVNEVVNPLFGKFKTLTNQYNELELAFADNYSLVFRAYNDGIAYRFVTRLPGKIKVLGEQSVYNFPGDPQTYMPLAKSLTAHYEEHYQHKQLSEYKDNDLAFSPLMIECPGKIKAVITESALLDYPGMYFEKQTVDGKSVLSGKWPQYPLEIVRNNPSYEVKKRADYIAETEGSRSFPWRMMIITDQEEKLLTNELVYLLAEPCKLDDTSWIKPGKVAWDWWYSKNLSGVDFKTGMNNETFEYYIDFAAANNVEYIIVDGGWSDYVDLSKPNKGIDIAYLASYGKTKNVGVIIWVPHNSLTLDLERYLDIYQSWGVAGLKIDFIERDDQLAVATHAQIAAAAAKRHLTVNFHGCSKPAGLQRTYPNLLNYEGVLGAEYNKWSELSTPDHHVMIPFLRMLSGPIDFTPGAMRNASKRNFRTISDEPMAQGTRCHELAMYVVFDQPLAMLSDAPTSYEREPKIMDFLSKVETTWDSTVVVSAKIGEHLALAKKKNNTWHIGALNNWTEREITIDFSFLPPGKFSTRMYTDGVNAGRVATDYKMTDSTVDSSTQLKLKLAPGGGAAIRITPAK